MTYKNIVLVDGAAADWEEALTLSGKALQEEGFVKDSFADACITREKKFPTGLPTEPGVAIPHTDRQHVNEMAICFLRLQDPVKFYRMDDPGETVDVKLIFNLAVNDPQTQLAFLQRLMGVLSDEEFLNSCITKTEEQLAPILYETIFQ